MAPDVGRKRVDAAPAVHGSGINRRLIMPHALPLLALGAAAFGWVLHVADWAPTYRALLSSVLPHEWLPAQGDSGGSPLLVATAVGVVLLAAVVAPTLVRPWGLSAWAQGSASPTPLRVWCFALSALRVAVVVVAPALVLIAFAIATPNDLGELPWASFGQGALLAWWPPALTVVAILWWSTGTTRRAVDRAVALRDRPPPGQVDPSSDWWQGADGHWYPPLH